MILSLNATESSLEKYSIPEFTADDGIEKSISWKIWINMGYIDFTYPLAEKFKVHLYNRFDNSTVDICKPDTHLGPQHKKKGQNNYIFKFFWSVTGDSNFQELLDSCEKLWVDISEGFL